MKKFLGIFIIFYIALVALMPKENLYYTLKNRLAQERIMMSEEGIKDQFYALKLDDVALFYDGIESVLVDQADIMVLGVYNTIHLTEVKAAKSLQKMFGFSADSVEIKYVVWNYKEASIYAEGDFGVLRGGLDLMEQKVKLLLEPSAAFLKSPLLRQYFKKSDEGYLYESKIK
ncbi:MAG: hypothetical protein K0U47_00035 [Epsilonproteobacteria bacterium]|nr:hypothetical protein [Campylobacterota bacterium]